MDSFSYSAIPENRYCFGHSFYFSLKFIIWSKEDLIWIGIVVWTQPKRNRKIRLDYIETKEKEKNLDSHGCNGKYRWLLVQIFWAENRKHQKAIVFDLVLILTTTYNLNFFSNIFEVTLGNFGQIRWYDLQSEVSISSEICVRSLLFDRVPLILFLRKTTLTLLFNSIGIGNQTSL